MKAKVLAVLGGCGESPVAIITACHVRCAIEAYENWNAVDKLRAYDKGEYRDERDERYQLAIRLASELKLDTLYSINAESYDIT
jgi:hypothetical protein